MPELPEVETTCRGVKPHLVGQQIQEVIIRERRLRYPVDTSLDTITGDTVRSIRRRAKYLIVEMQQQGHLIIHLGMSGSLRICDPSEDYRKHDHITISLSSGQQLRYHDPRRFGMIVHLPDEEPDEHKLISHLGPEPLGEHFDVDALYAATRQRKAAIKLVIMDNKVVVGVGNIYASEALFRAGIRPGIAASRLSRPRLARLVKCIQAVLSDAIEQGGTTLRDFLGSDGEPGYFKQFLYVYGREGQPCRKCEALIRHKVMGQRATFWCPKCQR